MSASGRGGGGRASQTPADSGHPAPPTPRQPAREGPGQPPAPAPLPRPGDRTGLPAPRPLSPLTSSPGARRGEYLERQRSSAMGPGPAPGVGRDGARDELRENSPKERAVLGSPPAPGLRGLTRAPGSGGARACRPRAARGLGERGEERARARRLLPQTSLATCCGSERAADPRPRGARAPPARRAVAAPGEPAARRPRGAPALWRPRSRTARSAPAARLRARRPARGSRPR